MNHEYHSPLIRELRDQLLATTPREDWFAHTLCVEEVLAEVDRDDAGVYGCLHERLLGSPPDTQADQPMSARSARADLCRLIEDLSAAARLPFTSASDEVLTVEQLAGELNVASKTISRWRRRGLVARYFLCEGRPRLGFLRRSIHWFARQHAAQVRRGAQFRHLTEAEREVILDDARQMRDEGRTVAQIVRAISATSGRCRETIRTVLRQHDGLGLLADDDGSETEQLKAQLYREFRQGETLAALARAHGRSPSFVRRAVAEMRVRRIRELPLDYIPNDDFERPRFEQTILAPTPESERKPRRPRVPKDLPYYLARLYEVPLLSARQELHLFRKFNYLKYRAAKLREQLRDQTPQARLMDEIERLYDEAVATKNALVRANLRLVVSIAKRYMARTEQFFDLVSDGNMSLIRAVDKFDYARGNKFSTYASWAIKKNYARSFANAVRQRDRFETSLGEVLTSTTEYRADPHEQEAAQHRREQDVQQLLTCLNERERRIIVRRFGLDTSRPPLTLKEVGVELGVSKERVRQIEARAIKKLRQAARQVDVESQPA